ncbi:polyribonucleotide nucleotidyltransferase [bacterium]|nr:polyribonucleotide nucleotidyltransferase [bacterium]
MLNREIESTVLIAGRDVSISTGVMAKQANGSVVLRCGNAVLLATAVMSKQPKAGIDFFPLTIEYIEKMYSSGKIPGGFFKRETRPSTGAVLNARLIDRPLRPLFPKGFYNDVQIAVTVLSFDPTVPMDYLGIVAASSALSVSDIPFGGPVGAASVGLVEGQLVVNPSTEQLENSDLHIVVAGTKDAILMVEAGANEVSEATILEAIALAHSAIKIFVALQESLAAKVSKSKIVLSEVVLNVGLDAQIREAMGNEIALRLRSGNKQATEDFLNELETRIVNQFSDPVADNTAEVKSIFGRIKKEKIRHSVIVDKIRPDGRALDEIREIEIGLGLLPGTHGSALFTRGETQSLGVLTLGTSDDEQMEDGLSDTFHRPYYFHYNFPPYSVGEVGNMARTGRRELGHGALAERAIKSVLPKKEDFPYTVRLVSEILESNGSSSMASVCSGILALMDAGVPIKAPVSGIAMGLLIEGNDYVILSDIQGLEDHYGDMDFKVAGTQAGITALQLDIKVGGLTQEILTRALEQANRGRLFILSRMMDVIAKPRNELAPNAPKIQTINIDPEKVGLLIGPGGKMIRKIEEDTKATVIVTDGATGQVSISARNQTDLDNARNTIVALTRNVEPGDVYNGKISRVTHFGAFVEIVPGKEGLMHVSAMGRRRIEKVEDVVSIGQMVEVKVKEIDAQNRINLVPTTPLVD